MKILMNNPHLRLLLLPKLMKTQIKIRMMKIKVLQNVRRGDEADASDYVILLKNN